MSNFISASPVASQSPPARPRLRAEPEDFVVEEVLDAPPSGHGPHTWVLVEKRLRTTDEVARSLARTLNLPSREVGYAGRKDRRAVTRQWFSLPALEPARALDLEIEGVRVLAAERHGEKLRLGALRGNRFALNIRGVDDHQARRARQRLDHLMDRGLPNAYGRQRFGRHGDNAVRGRAILAGERPRGGHRAALFLVSACQSLIFNEVLMRRPLPIWLLMRGDLAWEHATGLLVPVADPAALAERAASFELSPTGPLFGTKMRTPRGVVADLERAVMEAHGLPAPHQLRPPRGVRIFGTRRPLRVPVGEARCEHQGDTLHLRFTLPAGSYATVLVESLFPDGIDEA